MGYKPKKVNDLVKEHENIRLAMEELPCDSFKIYSISHDEFMKRMNRTLTPTSHPVGYGWTVGNYAGEVLKIVLPQEQWMEFVKTQPDGKEKI